MLFHFLLCLFPFKPFAFIGVKDLQNFVSIALATAAGGEDDYTRDRLSNLRAVGSGYSTLIYNLPLSTSYKQLEKKCESLWEALRHYPDLPNWMVINELYILYI